MSRTDCYNGVELAIPIALDPITQMYACGGSQVRHTTRYISGPLILTPAYWTKAGLIQERRSLKARLGSQVNGAGGMILC
jgi:hypothetical protein